MGGIGEGHTLAIEAGGGGTTDDHDHDHAGDPADDRALAPGELLRWTPEEEGRRDDRRPRRGAGSDGDRSETTTPGAVGESRWHHAARVVVAGTWEPGRKRSK